MENKNLERSADNLKCDLHRFVNKLVLENGQRHKEGLSLSSDCDQVVNDLIGKIEKIEGGAHIIQRYKSKISDLEWQIDDLEYTISGLKRDNAKLNEDIKRVKQELESI